jgi:hypothetical protein
MRPWPFLVGFATLLSCTPSDCPPTVELLPAAGSGALQSGKLVAHAEDQSITISPGRDYMDYRFKLDGVSYVARYALNRDPPPAGYAFVFIRRPPPIRDCGTIAEDGPVIDSIQVKRANSTIAYGKAFQASNRCTGQTLGASVPSLDDAPDGRGVPLGDSVYGWQLTYAVLLEPEDQILVTVLDSSGAEFEVLAGWEQYQSTLLTSLGTLHGTGAVTMP